MVSTQELTELRAKSFLPSMKLVGGLALKKHRQFCQRHFLRKDGIDSYRIVGHLLGGWEPR